MTVSGGIKFFEPNLADSKTGTDAVATSGDPSADFILDRNQYTVWRSVGSNDATTEIIEIIFPSIVTITRIFIINHNWKDFSIKYRAVLGGPVLVITGAVGINNTPHGDLNEGTYALNTAYYEIPTLVAASMWIEVRKTQIPNQEKFLNSFVVSTEIGTLGGYPIVKNVTKDKKLRKSILLNGRSFVIKSLEVFRFAIDFKNYPPGLENDLDLIYSLFDRDANFYTWLCGGRNGDPYFKYQLRGFRIEDLILTQVVNIFKDKYRKNTYNSMVDMKLNLEEAG